MNLVDVKTFQQNCNNYCLVTMEICNITFRGNIMPFLLTNYSFHWLQLSFCLIGSIICSNQSFGSLKGAHGRRLCIVLPSLEDLIHQFFFIPYCCKISFYYLSCFVSKIKFFNMVQYSLALAAVSSIQTYKIPYIHWRTCSTPLAGVVLCHCYSRIWIKCCPALI